MPYLVFMGVATLCGLFITSILIGIITAGVEDKLGELRKGTSIVQKDAIARIISNTCRQHGLSQVLSEIFSFDGNELYFEKISELEGKSFKEAVLSLSNATVVGICKEGKVTLNPAMDTVIDADTELVVIEADDGAYKINPDSEIDDSKICNAGSSYAEASNNLVVLGTNDKLPIILSEYDKYVEPGTTVIIVDNDFDEAVLDSYDNLEIKICTEAVSRDMLCKLLAEDVNNILLMNDDSEDAEESDSQTLLRLILLRDIADKSDRSFAITTEMRNADNQRLALQARVDDFVIGSNFASLLLAQISENANMAPVIMELLDESGSELYMKQVAQYVTVGEPVNFYTLTESAVRKGEIFVGYRHADEAVVVNPDKSMMVTFGANDQVVVIAEN